MPGQFQQHKVGHPIVVVGADVVVLGFAHPHFVLQHFGHRGDAFAVSVHSDGIHIFGEQIIIFLLFEIPLVVHQVVGGIQVLGLQILAGVLLCQFDVFDINDGLAGFIAFVQTIENGNTQREARP